jgi:ribosomal protein S18 acetylase RimI-like enzyme
MLDAAESAGASRVFLETEVHNERVRAFYARLGFRTDASVWMSKDLAGR